MSENRKAYSVTCDGKTVRTFRTHEEANELRQALIEDPGLFIKVEEWDPGEFYNYVGFEDEKADDPTLFGPSGTSPLSSSR